MCCYVQTLVVTELTSTILDALDPAKPLQAQSFDDSKHCNTIILKTASRLLDRSLDIYSWLEATRTRCDGQYIYQLCHKFVMH